MPIDPVDNFFCSTRAAALGFKNILRHFVIFRKLIKITCLTVSSVPSPDQILRKLPKLNFCPVVYFVHRCGTRDRTWNLEGQNFAAYPFAYSAVAEVGLEPTSPDSESGAQPVKLLCIDAIFNARK